ncbi:TPA: hypothetical protein ACH3X1_000886 [Trebouxia sp. C0004]
MQPLCTAIAALSVLLSTSRLVSSQSCPAEADSDLFWPEQKGNTAFTCRPVTFPSGNRQQTHSGQRLNTYFTYWRSSQTITSPLPIALVITFHSQTCLFSKALLPLMDEVAQQYAQQSIRFIQVDTAQLAYSDMIKMGITSVPVIRLHTQVKRLTYSGDRSLSALTQYITNYTEIAVVPQQHPDQLAFDLDQTVYTKVPKQVEDRESVFLWSKTLLHAVSQGVSSPWSLVSRRHFRRKVRHLVFMLGML